MHNAQLDAESGIKKKSLSCSKLCTSQSLASALQLSMCASLKFEILLPDPLKEIGRVCHWALTERRSFESGSHDSTKFLVIVARVDEL